MVREHHYMFLHNISKCIIMAKYANGNRSLAISDRSGQAFPYGEMVTEWNGSFVHISEYEPKHLQIRRKK